MIATEPMLPTVGNERTDSCFTAGVCSYCIHLQFTVCFPPCRFIAHNLQSASIPALRISLGPIVLTHFLRRALDKENNRIRLLQLYFFFPKLDATLARKATLYIKPCLQFPWGHVCWYTVIVKYGKGSRHFRKAVLQCTKVTGDC